MTTMTPKPMRIETYERRRRGVAARVAALGFFAASARAIARLVDDAARVLDANVARTDLRRR